MRIHIQSQTAVQTNTGAIGVYLAQVWGIARYDLRMQWRRWGLALLWLAFNLGMIALGTLWFGGKVGEAIGLGVTMGIPREVFALEVLCYNLTLGILPLCIGVPLMLAETIPQDRTFGVTDLLESTATPYWLYLLGKLVSVWLCMVAGIIVSMIVIGASIWLNYGAFDLLTYTLIWFTVMLPGTMLIAAFGLLWPSRASSRRWSAIQSLLVMPYMVYLMVWTLGSLFKVVAALRPPFGAVMVFVITDQPGALLLFFAANVVAIFVVTLARGWFAGRFLA